MLRKFLLLFLLGYTAALAGESDALQQLRADLKVIGPLAGKLTVTDDGFSQEDLQDRTCSLVVTKEHLPNAVVELREKPSDYDSRLGVDFAVSIDGSESYPVRKGTSARTVTGDKVIYQNEFANSSGAPASPDCGAAGHASFVPRTVENRLVIDSKSAEINVIYKCPVLSPKWRLGKKHRLVLRCSFE